MKSRQVVQTIALSLIFTTVSAYLPNVVNAKTINKPTITSKQNINGKYKIGDKNVTVSKVLTFNQIVEMIAKDNNISKEDAANQVIAKFYKDNVKNGNYSISSLSDAKAIALQSTYRSVTETFDVNAYYHPALRFYCETSEGDYMWGIVRILNVGMNRYADGFSKQFSGTVYTNLEDGGTIYWTVNGDFYDNGTTNVSGGVNIGIGSSATVNFSVSYSSNHYAYCYKEGRYSIYN